MSETPKPGQAPGAGDAPPRAGLVLIALILVAAVANLNLAVANVALPDIGKAFDSSQVTLNLIAVYFLFPKKNEEEELLDGYRAEDSQQREAA